MSGSSGRGRRLAIAPSGKPSAASILQAALNRMPDLLAARRKTAGEILLDLGKDLSMQTASEALKQAVQVILGA